MHGVRRELRAVRRVRARKRRALEKRASASGEFGRGRFAERLRALARVRQGRVRGDDRAEGRVPLQLGELAPHAEQRRDRRGRRPRREMRTTVFVPRQLGELRAEILARGRYFHLGLPRAPPAVAAPTAIARRVWGHPDSAAAPGLMRRPACFAAQKSTRND